MASNTKCVAADPTIEMIANKTFDMVYGMLLAQSKGDDDDLLALIELLITMIVCSSPNGLYQVDIEFNCPREFVEVATDARDEVWKSFIPYSNGDKRLLRIQTFELIARLAHKAKTYSSMDIMKEELIAASQRHIS